MAVRKIGGGTDSVNDLQSEGVCVKLNQFVHVLGEYREMADACHDSSSFALVGCILQNTDNATLSGRS
jgi:hypothetical protein